MTLQSFGSMSYRDINVELGRSPTSQISLYSAEVLKSYGALNYCSPSKPDEASPDSVAEWYGYNHNATKNTTAPVYRNTTYYYVSYVTYNRLTTRASVAHYCRQTYIQTRRITVPPTSYFYTYWNTPVSVNYYTYWSANVSVNYYTYWNTYISVNYYTYWPLYWDGTGWTYVSSDGFGNHFIAQTFNRQTFYVSPRQTNRITYRLSPGTLNRLTYRISQRQTSRQTWSQGLGYYTYWNSYYYTSWNITGYVNYYTYWIIGYNTSTTYPTFVRNTTYPTICR